MHKSKIISPKKIIDTVANFYGVSARGICGEHRKKELVKARHMVMYLLREELHESYPRIGKRIGNKDHTTAIHACEKIKNDLRKEELQREIEIIRAGLREKELQALRKPKAIPKKKEEKKEITKEKYATPEILRSIESLRKSSPSFVVSEREKSMLEEWRLGKTLEGIGKEWKLTRERVRQIIIRGILREIAKKQNEGFEIDIREFLKQEKKRHGVLRDQLSRKVKPSGKVKTEKPRRWSRYYICCRVCGTTIIPHSRHGLCQKCDGSLNGRHREEIISAAGGKCEMCGKDRSSSFQEFRRDFYITRLSPREGLPLKYMVLCRQCFMKLTGKKMAAASGRHKKASD